MLQDAPIEYNASQEGLNSEPQRRVSLNYEKEVRDIIESVLKQGQEPQMKRLMRMLYSFIQTLRNDQSVNPRFVELLDDAITSHPRFQSMLFDIMQECTKDGRVEEFLRLSTEYSTIFHIREAILENDGIQALIKERLAFMEANKQYSTVYILRSYMRK